MRIGITTFHHSHNYGALLQAYALHTYLREYTNESVEFIDYWAPESKITHRILPKVQGLRSAKQFIFALSHYPKLKKRFDGFDRFISIHFPRSKQCYSIDEFMATKPRYDVIVSGSDQVFRYKNHNSEFFFLPFAKEIGCKTIAYAPSFGTTFVHERCVDKVSRLLDNFDHLSCREKEGARIIKELTGKSVPVVMDPIFLLDVRQWQALAGVDLIIDEEYILCYALVGSEPQIRLAKLLQRETGYRIILISTPMAKKSPGLDLFIPEPPEFVNLFMNASIVVTDSFHGTAFSIRFKKPFLTYIAIPQASSRISNILEETGLQGHLIEHGAIADIDLVRKSRDYSTFDMDNLVNRSLVYLKEALNAKH